MNAVPDPETRETLQWLRDLGHPANVRSISILLFMVVFAAFSRALFNGFVHYDDPLYVTANAHVQSGLTAQSVAWAFGASAAGNWHPVTWLSHILDAECFGPKPWGHHLTSVALHALNTALVFVVLRGLTNAAGRSLAVALLFGLHPLRVESVAWVAERKDVLSGFFWLLTMWAYARYVNERNARNARAGFCYALALGFFALGLMAKPMVVTLPCVLLLLDFWPLRRLPAMPDRVDGSPGMPIWTLLLEKIPFLLLAGGSSVVTFIVQRNFGAVAAVLPWTTRWENACVSYWRYIGKLLCPAGLAAIYPYPDHWPWTTVALSVMGLALVSMAVIAWRRERPYLLVGWFWFIGTLIPVIGLVQVGVQAMADRYTYIPSLGVFLAIVWGIYDLTRDWKAQATAAVTACAVLALVCGAITFRQIGYWRDDERLFRHALAVTENNWVAHNDLGAALLPAGKFDEAIKEFHASLGIYSRSNDAHNNLGIALKGQGRLDEAITEYRAAIQIAPRDAGAHNNLGMALKITGHLDEAIKEFQQAVLLQSDLLPARLNLTEALAERQKNF